MIGKLLQHKLLRTCQAIDQCIGENVVGYGYLILFSFGSSPIQKHLFNGGSTTLHSGSVIACETTVKTHSRDGERRIRAVKQQASREDNSDFSPNI